MEQRKANQAAQSSPMLLAPKQADESKEKQLLCVEPGAAEHAVMPAL